MASTPTNFYNCQAPVSEDLVLFRVQGMVPNSDPGKLWNGVFQWLACC